MATINPTAAVLKCEWGKVRAARHALPSPARPPARPPAACPFSAGAAAGPQCPHKVFICLYSVSASALGETVSGKPRPGELFLGRDTPSAAPGCRRPAGGRRLPTAVASGPRTAAEDRRAHRRAHRRDWRRKRQTRRDEGLIACGTDTRPGTVTPPNPVQGRQPSSMHARGERCPRAPSATFPSLPELSSVRFTAPRRTWPPSRHALQFALGS